MDFEEFEEEFKKYNWYGGEKSESFYLIKGKGNVIISCPHSVRLFREDTIKPQDLFTGALGKYISKYSLCHLIYKTKCDKDDANFVQSSAYRDELIRFIKENGVKYLIDLHASSFFRPYNIDIGTNFDKNIKYNEEIKNLLTNTFAEHNIDEVTFNNTFFAGKNAVSNIVNNETGIITMQLEINRKLRENNEALEKVGNAILDIVSKLEKLK